MNENAKLLDEVAKDRLEKVLNSSSADDTADVYFKQAMDAIDRRTALSKNKKDWIVPITEIAVTAIVTPIIYTCCNIGYANRLAIIEQFDTFRTQGGKLLSRLFFTKR